MHSPRQVYKLPYPGPLLFSPTTGSVSTSESFSMSKQQEQINKHPSQDNFLAGELQRIEVVETSAMAYELPWTTSDCAYDPEWFNELWNHLGHKPLLPNNSACESWCKYVAEQVAKELGYTCKPSSLYMLPLDTNISSLGSKKYYFNGFPEGYTLCCHSRIGLNGTTKPDYYLYGKPISCLRFIFFTDMIFRL